MKMNSTVLIPGAILIFITIAFAGCSAAPVKSLDQVQIGMDKDQVLEIAGNPKRTYRENMRDHWIYIYFHENQEWRREFTFNEGKVAKIERPIPKEEWVKDLENANSMEEYEQKAREHQKKAANFKPVDGTPPDESDEKPKGK